MTGNRERSRLIGYDQFLLCLCYLTWPHVQADEAASFVYRNGGGLYERPIIYRRCKELKMSRKRASTEAHQAYTPRNILRCQLFWSQPPPIGVHQTPRRLMIDFDECGLELQSCNRRHGMAFSGLRVRKRGNYSRDTKLTVIMAVEPGDPNLPNNVYGSIAWPRRWVWVSEDAGTTAVRFAQFTRYVMEYIENNPLPLPQQLQHQQKYFLWDNLGSHLAPLVYQTVQGRPGGMFDIILRPPYKPQWGPIEYVFCQLADRLRDRIFQIHTLADLRQQILIVSAQLSGFDGTFAECGYTN
jgi:hypothetical protein